MLESFFTKDTKEISVQVFSCEICEIFKNTFLEENLRTTASGSSDWVLPKPKDDVLKADQLYSSNQNTLLLIWYKVPIALLMSAVFV